MDAVKQELDSLLALANHYPSPHNGQPIRVKAVNGTTLDLYFVLERGLQAADISFIFSFVSMGVFVEHLTYCARALGHDLTYELDLPKERELRGKGMVPFGRCRLAWHARKADPTLEQIIVRRQTSRKKYGAGVDDKTAARLTSIASDAGMRLARLEPAVAHRAIWLNQRAVFDDMFDEPTRRELDHWLRYNKQQKESARDGLAYDCMELNGRLMKFFVDHHQLLRWPGIAQLIRQYYLRTMRDASDVFYMLAPFASEAESFRVGTVIMRIWLALTEHGYYLHPFGTIMSNRAAHQDFVKLAGIQHETREASYLVFIFRGGISAPPVPSTRLPYTEHLLLP